MTVEREGPMSAEGRYGPRGTALGKDARALLGRQRRVRFNGNILCFDFLFAASYTESNMIVAQRLSVYRRVGLPIRNMFTNIFPSPHSLCQRLWPISFFNQAPQEEEFEHIRGERFKLLEWADLVVTIVTWPRWKLDDFVNAGIPVLVYFSKDAPAAFMCIF